MRLFEAHHVTYALVDGYAVNYYGYMRMTQDVDFLLDPSPANATRIMDCLEAFGFAGAGIPAEEAFEREGMAIHLGVEPNRLDLLTALKGVPNAKIFAHAQRVVIDGIDLAIIGFDALLTVKRSSARLRDQADAEELARLLG